MVNQQVLEGKWNEIQGKLRNRWAQLSEDDLQRFDGSVQQLVGMIQQKTGEARAKIETVLEELTSSSSVAAAVDGAKAYAKQAADTASDYVSEAGSSIRDGAYQVSESARAGLQQTEEIVRRRPAESLAVCFGAGLLAGVVAGLLLRSK